MNHFSIPVKDLAESEKFYNQLGFEKKGQWQKPDQKLSAIYIEQKGFRIELIHHPKRTNLALPKMPELLHLAIEVKNIDDVINKLEKFEIEIAKPRTEGVSVKAFAFIRDPNGFAIELFEK